MARITKCDRCGKEIEKNKGSWIRWKYSYKNVVEVLLMPEHGRFVDQSFDLCPKCASSFADWLLKPAKEESINERKKDKVQ